MPDKKKKGTYIGLAGALLVHVLFFAFLFLVGFSLPQEPEEGGVPVVLGSPFGEGGGGPELVEVDVLPEEAVQPLPPSVAADQPLLTQDAEETVAVEEQPDERPAKPAVDSAALAERRAEEEARRAAEEARQKRLLAEKATRQRVANAFGKGARMGSGDAGDGSEAKGSPEGNAAQGLSAGVGGYGSFDLGGRSIGEGGLPRPVYNVQDEGMVVVDITVNPAGYVIATGINLRTNTVNPTLRRAAEEAARKARFNAVDGLNNQRGTITYFFNLK